LVDVTKEAETVRRQRASILAIVSPFYRIGRIRVNRHVLLRNAFSAAGQTLVQTAALFLVYRYLIDELGIERLGVWGVVLATTSVARVGELGLASSVTRFLSSHRAQGDERAAREGLETAALSLAGILALLLPALYLAVGPLLPRLLPAAAMTDARAVLPYAFISMWLTAVAGIWLGGLDGCLRSDLRAGLVIFSTLVFTVLALVSVPAYGLVGLAVAQVVQAAIVTVLGWVALRHVMRPMPVVPISWNAERFREMVGYGVNMQIMALVMLLFEPMTKVLFVRYGGLASAGYFELAQQLVMKARALVVESNRVVVPVLAGMARSAPEARRFYAKNVRYLVFLLTPFFAALAVCVPAISELWIGRYERQFVIMTIAVVVAWYANSLAAPTYFAYLGEGRLRWPTLAHVALGIANAALGLMLGPAFGWPGVTAAFAISLTMGSLLPVWTYHREHHLRLREILSRADVLLMAGCLLVATAGVAGYSMLVAWDASRWLRLATATTAAGALALAVYAHPLAPELVLLMRRGGGREPNTTR
jgi:O-antigen/teichoic acid export membrane protein